MLHAALYQDWKQQFGHLPPISKIIQIYELDTQGTAVEVRTNLYNWIVLISFIL